MIRNLLILLVVAASISSAKSIIAAEPSKAAFDERPNVILFLTDDQRHDQLGCAGHPFLKTPNIDALANTGVRFSNAFVTTSICAASRATIFTGLYERSHKYTFRTPPIAAKFTDLSYPTLMKKAGYRTGFIGKFGVGVTKGAREEMFDYFKPLNRNPYFKKQKDGSKRHITELCGDHAIDFISEKKGEEPFCLQVSFNAAHAEDSDKKDHFPWPKAMDGMYDDIKLPAPRLSDPKIYDEHPDFMKNSFNRVRYFWRWDTKEKYEKNIRAYYRMISGIDRTIGRVMNHLKEKKLDKNTVVIFIGDNGYYMAQRGFAGKWSHYEESLRVPLIINDPRQKQHSVLPSIALNVDVPATILDIAGIEIPKSYQGQSLMWAYKMGLNKLDGPDGWRKDFFCEHLMHVPGKIPKWEGVRGERYVYARYFEQKPAFEYLHDLQEDPNQLKNLAKDPKHAKVLEKMRSRCIELRDDLGGEYSYEKFPLVKGAKR